MATPCNSMAPCWFLGIESASRQRVRDGPVVSALSWQYEPCWMENPLPAASNISASHQRLFALSRTATSHNFCSARDGRSLPRGSKIRPTWRPPNLRGAKAQASGVTARRSRLANRKMALAGGDGDGKTLEWKVPHRSTVLTVARGRHLGY
jgi:hypothetical protein